MRVTISNKKQITDFRRDYHQRTRYDNFADQRTGLLGHEPYRREYDEADEECRTGVGDCHNDSVSVEIIVEPIVAGHGDKSPPRGPHTVEQLLCSFCPWLQYNNNKIIIIIHIYFT